MQLRRRFWLEVVSSAIAGLLGVLTAIVPDWIEEVFRVAPDAGSGALEWGIVVVLIAIAIALGVSAARVRPRSAPGRRLRRRAARRRQARA